MTNKDLADLIFPNLTKTVEDYEKMYPERNLKEGAAVTRFAPSPTGYMHIGNFMSTIINYVLSKATNGVFYLRNEDTDKAREIPDAVEKIMETLEEYNLMPDEYEYQGVIVGSYGPYIQSERITIYHAYIKRLIEIGKAYPCFCTRETLDDLRKNQEEKKMRTGYYGRFAKCRNISTEEAITRIKNGEPYVIRFKSEGNPDKKFVFEDLVKGRIEFPENDQDTIIMKSDNLLPTYHFAHLVDDHLMHTTHVVRGEEWLSSVPLHIELFKAFGYKPPKYIHIPLIMKQDGDIKRKISKRKDPEASMSFYKEKGYRAKLLSKYVEIENRESYNEDNKVEKNENLPIKIGIYEAYDRISRNIYNQLCAVSMIENAKLDCSPVNYKISKIARFFNINLTVANKLMTKQELYKKLANNDINLCVSTVD